MGPVGPWARARSRAQKWRLGAKPSARPRGPNAAIFGPGPGPMWPMCISYVYLYVYIVYFIYLYLFIFIFIYLCISFCFPVPMSQYPHRILRLSFFIDFYYFYRIYQFSFQKMSFHDFYYFYYFFISLRFNKSVFVSINQFSLQ